MVTLVIVFFVIFVVLIGIVVIVVIVVIAVLWNQNITHSLSEWVSEWETERDREKYIICCLLWKVFCYIFFRDFATKFAPPPWGKMAVTPLTGVTDSWFFFYQKDLCSQNWPKPSFGKKKCFKVKRMQKLWFFFIFRYPVSLKPL